MSELNPYDLFLDALIKPLQDPDEVDRNTKYMPEPHRSMCRNDWLIECRRKERTMEMMDMVSTMVADKLALRFADAFDAFWNPALTSVQSSDARIEFAIVGAMSEGMAAIAHKLREKSDGQG